MGIDSRGKRFCDECGNPMRKAHRVEQGKEYCANCYPRVFEQVACASCARPARVLRYSPQAPLCPTCARQGRTCVRCDKPIARAGIRVGQRFACAACAPYFREKKPCSGCGRPSSRLSRLNGEGEPLCDRCRQRATHVSCATCRKFRLPSFTSQDGKQYCASCVPGKEVTHTCPQCGHPVAGSGNACCVRCYNRGAVLGRAELNAAAFAQPWARELLREYAKWLCANYPAKPALHKQLERHVPFFARIDATFTSTTQLDGNSMVYRLGSAFLRKYLLASRFVQHRMAAPVDAQKRASAAEDALLTDLQARAERSSAAVLLGAYWSALQEEPIAARTRRAYFSTALRFCESRGSQASQGPPAAVITSFLRATPGARNNLMRFATFARAQRGWEFPMGPRPLVTGLPATVRRVARLQERIENVTVANAATRDLMALLAVTLGFPSAQALARARFRTSAEHTELQVGSERVIVPDKLRLIAVELERRQGS